MTSSERFEQLKKKYQYDSEAAEEKIEFIESFCTHTKGDLAGQPLILEEWQKDEILRPIFGLKRADGRRLIRMAYIQMPKKNAKTTLCAAIELSLLVNDGEAGAEIYNCAGSDDQAGILFRDAKTMVEQSPQLSELCKTYRGSIMYKNSFIQKLTSKSDTKHGVNAHGVIYDELHVASDRELYDNLKTAMAMRSNPLFLIITTPGFDQATICYNRYDYAKSILNGHIEDDTYWAVIYESDSVANIFDPKIWRECNPLYDTSRNMRESLEIEAQEVKNDSTNENAFRRLRLGQWTRSAVKFVSLDKWDACRKNVNWEDYKGKRCTGALDLASTEDMNAFALKFEDGALYLMFFCPEDTVYSSKRKALYLSWVKECWLTMTPGNVTDYDFIKKKVLESKYRFDLRSIAYDRWNSSQLVIDLTNDEGVEMMQFGQGYSSMTSPTKSFKKLILEGELIHDGNPIMRWMMDNIMIKEDEQQNVKISKKDSKDKVDGPVAAVMAIGEEERIGLEGVLEWGIV